MVLYLSLSQSIMLLKVGLRRPILHGNSQTVMIPPNRVVFFKDNSWYYFSWDIASYPWILSGRPSKSGENPFQVLYIQIDGFKEVIAFIDKIIKSLVELQNLWTTVVDQ